MTNHHDEWFQREKKRLLQKLEDIQERRRRPEIKCDRCKGSGNIQTRNKRVIRCPRCNGLGYHFPGRR